VVLDDKEGETVKELVGVCVVLDDKEGETVKELVGVFVGV